MKRNETNKETRGKKSTKSDTKINGVTKRVRVVDGASQMVV